MAVGLPFPAFPSEIELQGTVNPVYPFMVPGISHVPDQMEQFGEAICRILLCQLHQYPGYLFIIPASRGLITVNRDADATETAYPSYTGTCHLLPYMLNGFTLLGRIQNFFPTISFRIWLSRQASAYIRLRRAFSCSSSRSLFRSDGCMPPYFARQL